MKLTRILSLMAGVLLTGHLHAAFAAAAAPAASTNTGAESRTAMSGNRSLISTTSGDLSSSESGSKTLLLTFPAGTRIDSLRAVLNGKDVSSSFSPTECAKAGGVCATGTLTEADGLRAGKNVLFATVKKEDGAMASSRLRFAGSTIATGAVRVAADSTARRSAVGAGNGITASFFTPPTVAVKTLTPGGWNGSSPWIAIGDEQLPSSNDAPCSSGQIYTVVVLDRQTLEEVKGATQCEADAPSLSAYLKTLTSDQIAIAGTNWLHNADANLDTSAIGGTNWSSTPQTNQYYPRGYVTIGAGSATPGSAYENYWADGFGKFDPYANGMFDEDANGNFNFQTSDAFEYIVNPNDQSNGGISTVTLLNVGSLFRYNQFSYPDKVVFTPPAAQTNGYWLLVLERDDLDYNTNQSNCSATANAAKQETDITGCGNFYHTGPGSTTRTADLKRLASDLNNITPNKLAILTTVGTPALGSPWEMANDYANSSIGNGNWSDNGYLEFAQALQQLGAPHKPTLYLGTANSAYTYITSLGLGNAISGHSVLSSSFFSQQGQTGYVHGVFTRNLQGLFQPGRSEQEPAAADTSDFTMDVITAQPPVEWPEFTTPILSGASSLQGQEDAFAYLSWYLLNGYYVPGQVGQEGVSAPYAYDIHYFFTGSLNTYIDIHTFDPLNAVWPGAQGFSGAWNIPCKSVAPGNSPTCTWVSPFDNTQLVFTQADFQAVQKQMHNEIVDLSNVLLFLVDGSSNMKDIVAAGNSNTALALLGAASEVTASINQPTVSTAKATVSPWNIVSMIGSVATLAGGIGTDGLVNPETVAAADKGINVVADLFGLTGTIGGGVAPPDSTTSGLPSQDLQLFTAIGDLANSGLQNQMLAGFDTMADTITGDWAKLSAIGPLVTDPGNKSFFFPNQVVQNATIAAMTQASQRSLYLSLLPQFYQVHYWPMGNGEAVSDPGKTVGLPAMGYNPSGETCNAFYVPNTPPPTHVSVWYPTYGGTWFQPAWAGGDLSYPYAGDNSNFPIDFFVLAAPFQNVGASDAGAQWPTEQLTTTLFSNSPGAVNFSFDAFVARGGPMDSTLNGGSSSWINATWVDEWDNNMTGHKLGSICAMNQNITTLPAPSATKTTTVLVAPASASVGQDVTMQATVASAVKDGPIPTGSVQFRDGSTILGTGTLDKTGSATFTASGLDAGTHSLAAYYISNGKSEASNSGATVLTVYANQPDMTLSISAKTVDISYGSTSSPVTVKTSSVSGLSGNVTFSCTGLPVGMNCNFSPAQPAIIAGGTATTSLTVTAVVPSTASTMAANLPWFKGLAGVLILPLSLILLSRIRKGARHIQALLCLLVLTLSVTGLLTGCGSSTKVINQPQTLPSGPQTILVNASTDSVTKTIPFTLNIK